MAPLLTARHPSGGVILGEKNEIPATILARCSDAAAALGECLVLGKSRLELELVRGRSNGNDRRPKCTRTQGDSKMRAGVPGGARPTIMQDILL